jgi:hypothetical protein
VDLETVEEIKRHVSVVVEGLRADFRFVIEGLGGVTDRLDRVESGLGRVELRLDRVELKLGGVEARLTGVESRLTGAESGRFTPRSDA